MTKRLFTRGANPDCKECGGEGFCEYAMGEDSYTDYCPECFPNGFDDGDAAYDSWKDDQVEIKK